MVSKLITGKSIKGALNYNEKKVNEEKAQLLFADKYYKDAGDLNYHEKLSRLTSLAARNERSKINCVHISLNFDPSESLNRDTLIAIARTYMDKIGFGDQPYLVYKHEDSGHPHMHIVTTNIQTSGKRIALHNIGKIQSEAARKAIEKEFGLLPAEGRGKDSTLDISSVLSKVIYGESETKHAISSVVSRVIKDYKFSSLAELNAILAAFNVTAFRGEEGSKMYAKRGLIYSVLDKKGDKVGVPIKASAIYSKPTLNNLEKLFILNKQVREDFKEPLKRTIDEVLLSKFLANKEALKDELARVHISTIYRQNDSLVFGVTFIDHTTKVVFKGSDLGKDYSAKRILERIGVGGLADQKDRKENQKFVEKVLEATDYTLGVPSAIAAWYQSGLRIKPVKDVSGTVRYYLGDIKRKPYLYQRASPKYEGWFKINNLSDSVINSLNNEFDLLKTEQMAPISLIQYLANFLKGILIDVPEYPSPSNAFNPKKKKHKKNW